MAKAGYARVSSVGQSLDVQREKLSECDRLFEEKRSGCTMGQHSCLESSPSFHSRDCCRHLADMQHPVPKTQKPTYRGRGPG